MKKQHKEAMKIFDTLFEAVLAARNGRIVYANPAAVTLFGKGTVGKSAEKYFGELLLDALGGDVSGEVVFNDKRLAVSAFNMDTLRVFTVIVPEEDRNVLKESNLVLSAGASLKNLLSVNMMSLDSLGMRLENDISGRLMQYVTAADKASHGMSRIVNDIVRLYSNDGEAAFLNSTVFDIVELCDDVADTVNYLVGGSAAKITFEASEDRILYYGDGDKLERLLLNLISNSLKYTEKDGKVTLSVRRTQSGVLIQLHDTGCGIPPEVLSTVFTRSTSTRKLADGKAGAGLGLSVVQQIARIHGGSAVIESKVGGGTTATVLLPFKKLPDDLLMDERLEYKNDISVFLTELSDILPNERYLPKYKE